VELTNAKPFFEGVRMIDDRKLLRPLTLQLGARLPAPKEYAAVQERGLAAISLIHDDLMNEEAFYDRLAEGFNDIFLTPGIDDVAENVLSYEHFEKTRHWYQKKDFSHIKDERKRKEAGWELARHYRESIQREPMELVKYIGLLPAVTAENRRLFPRRRFKRDTFFAVRSSDHSISKIR
jgi:hypothetical protein